MGLAAVGWGFPWPTGADIVVFRRPVKVSNHVKYVVCIPGTSFKGALRSAASRIARAYKFSSCEGSCDGNLCDVCRLFGIPEMKSSSQLKVSDFYADDARTLTLTRIRIDDRLQKVAENALFTQECLFPGTTFTGEIEFSEDIEKNLVKLLLLGLAELRLGRLGRSSIFDLRIRNPETLRGILDDDKWIHLLEDLGRWIWSEIS